MNELIEISDTSLPRRATELPRENLYGHTKKLRFFLDRVEARLRERRSASVVDFGCGNGSAVSRYLIMPGVRYVGVEIHEPSIRYAEAHYAGPNARFTKVFPMGETFDFIVYSDVLEHLEDPAGTLHQHIPTLAPDGEVLGAIPNGFGPFEMENRFDRWFKIGAILDLPARIKRARGNAPSSAPSDGALPYNAESGHVQFFTRGGLRRLLEGAGLEIVTFRNGACIGAPLSEVYLFPPDRIPAWNTSLADRLPWWAVSSWHFAAKRPV